MSDDATRAVLARYTKQVDVTATEMLIAYQYPALDVTAMAARIAELERDAMRLDWLEQISHEAIEIESFGDPVMIDWAGERDNPRIATESTLRTAIDAGMVRYPLRNAEATHD